MYVLRQSFNLAVCLAGYWLGRQFGGWGGGILLAFAALLATSYGWEWIVRTYLVPDGKGTVTMNFAYGVASSLAMAAAIYLLWGK